MALAYCAVQIQKEEQKMSVRPDDGWYVLFSEQDQFLYKQKILLSLTTTGTAHSIIISGMIHIRVVWGIQIIRKSMSVRKPNGGVGPSSCIII